MSRKGLQVAIIFQFLFLLNMAQSGFRGGAILGISASQVHGDTYSGFDKAGLNVGGFVMYELAERWDAKMEMVYTQKGSRKNPRPDQGDYDMYLLRLNYIEIPLLIRWHFGKFSLESGASLAALISDHEENQFGVVNNPVPTERTDLAFLLGINFNITEKLYINLRNSNSLLPVKKFAQPLYYPSRLQNLFNKGMYNNVMILAAHYEF